MESKLKNYLDNLWIEYETFQHKPIFTVKESMEMKEKIPGLHCKCLFLKDNNGKYYLVAMKASKRLDIKKLERYFGVKKLRFGSEDELWDILKLKPGSVSIFGMINCKSRAKLIIDYEVYVADKVGFHPNINTSTIVLNNANFLKYYNSLKCEEEVLKL